MNEQIPLIIISGIIAFWFGYLLGQSESITMLSKGAMLLDAAVEEIELLRKELAEWKK